MTAGPTAPTRAAAYVRVSTDRQAKEGLSLDEQRRRVEAHVAGQEGWKLVDTFIECGVSGRKDDRPELRRLLEAVDRGDLDAVVIPKLDRFGRSVRQLHENFARLDRAGVALVSLTESIDTSTSVGRLLRAVLAALAEFESDTIGDRVASVTAARAQSGKAHGRVPFGYRPAGKEGIIVVPAEAAIVRRIFREYAAGVSQRQIARDLNREGIRAKMNGEWVQGSISKVLSNPVYAGTVRLNGDQYDGTHKAVIDSDTWRKAEQMRLATARSDGGRGRTPTANHVLAGGLLRCGCGAPMNAITKPTRTPSVAYEVYTCSRRASHGLNSCPQGPVKRRPIDEAVWRFFERVALDVDATKAAITEHHDSKLSEIDLLRAQADREAQKTTADLARIERDYRNETLAAEQWSRLDVKLTDELAAATAQVARLDDRRQTIVAEMGQIDAESAVLEQIAALRAMVVGEVRAGGREGVDAFRAALRRQFAGFELLGGARPFGSGLGTQNPQPGGSGHFDESVGWPHPDLTVSCAPLTLYPRVREDVIDGWGDGEFPALRRAALTLRESDANTLHT